MIKSRDLLAGLFVVFGIVLLMFAVAWSDKLTTWFDSRRELTLLLPRGVPIEIGQAVRMEGIRVGEVTGYRIRDDAARRQSHPERHLELVLRVDPALAIGRNTEIQLTGDGLLGARYIQLRSPTEELIPLAEGEALLGQLGGIDYMLAGMREMTDSLNGAMAGLERLAGGPEQEGSLIQTVSSLSDQIEGLMREAASAVRELRELTAELKPELSAALQGGRRVIDELAGMLADNRGSVSELVHKLRSTLEQIQGSVARLETETAGLMREAREPIGRLDRLLQKNDQTFYVLLHNLRVATDELKVGLARFFADPSQLIFGSDADPERAAEAARRSLERDLLDRRRLPARDRR
jgi:ABC-type transporter Mla subunit MlaD